MTAEEIRAEAIDRIAREGYEREYRPLAQSLAHVRGEPPVPEFDAAQDAHQAKRHFRAKAEKSIDALGDLLPTGIERAERHLTDIYDPVPAKRWTHNWTGDPA